jgi:hypothetical protein
MDIMTSNASFEIDTKHVILEDRQCAWMLEKEGQKDKGDAPMVLKEGDRVKKKETGMLYEVRKVDYKGFIILSSEDGSRTALMNMENLDLNFALVCASPTGG